VAAIAHRADALQRIAALLVGGLALARCGEVAVTRESWRGSAKTLTA
jgi:hypothetical protein